MNKIIFKIAKLTLTINTIFVSLFILSSCSLDYQLDTLEDYYIGYSHKNAFIGCVNYNLETTEIHLPSFYKGVKVESLGGYFGRGVPTPFCVEYNGISNGFSTNLDNISGNDTIIETYIDIYLPDYLKECNYLLQLVIGTTLDDHDIIYIARCNYYISSDNDYFYSKNGKSYIIKVIIALLIN